MSLTAYRRCTFGCSHYNSSMHMYEYGTFSVFFFDRVSHPCPIFGRYISAEPTVFSDLGDTTWGGRVRETGILGKFVYFECIIKQILTRTCLHIELLPNKKKIRISSRFASITCGKFFRYVVIIIIIIFFLGGGDPPTIPPHVHQLQ